MERMEGGKVKSRICKTRRRGRRRGGNGTHSSDNLHCHHHATKLDVARRGDALYNKRRRASHLHKVNCTHFVTYGISYIYIYIYELYGILPRDLYRERIHMRV